MNGIDFLFDRINYERRSALPYNDRRLKLENMARLLKLLGDPHMKYPIVHIAGTKGKGSVATMLTSILLNSGYRVGTYNSPHMTHVGERFLLNGQITSPETVLELIDRIRPCVLQLDQQANESNRLDRPTFFEITTAMAFDFFAVQHVDCAVIEVGLGGRLDSTNICSPILSVITSISFDHTKQLGDSLAEIATEKAGIIKQGIPVVSGVTQQEPREAIKAIANKRSSNLFELGQDFVIRSHPAQSKIDSNGSSDDSFQLPAPIEFDLVGKLNNEELNLTGILANHPGEHQQRNAAVAAASAKLISQRFPRIRDQTIRSGLCSATIRGRIELLCDNPPIVVDVAHNVASAQALIDTISPAMLDYQPTLIYATSRDKDFEGVLKIILPHFKQAIFTQFTENPRSRDPAEIEKIATKIVAESGLDIQLTSRDNPESALELALEMETKLASISDLDRNEKDFRRSLICVTGSVFIVAELRELIKTRFASTSVLSGE